MPRIPEYNEQYRYAGRAGNLGGRLNPSDYGGTAGAIGASSRIAGQQWQQAGAALTKAADTAAAIYDDYNTTKAQQAVNGLQKNFLAWQSEMAKNKGEAGMDAGAQYEQWQKKQVAELTKGMNDFQRGRFNALAEVKAAGFRQWAADYGSEQGLVFRNAEDVAGIKASGEVLVANLTNPSIAEPAIDSICKNAESIANRKGLGEAARAQFIKDALSESITPAIAAQIDAGKLSTARTALLHYKDKIGAANALKLQAAIQREGRRLEAEARAERERAETQSTLSSVSSLLQDTSGMPQAKRESAIMEAIAQEPDIKRRQRMASVARSEIAFEEMRISAQTQKEVVDFHDQTSGLSPIQKMTVLEQNNTLTDAARTKLRDSLTTDWNRETLRNQEAFSNLLVKIDEGKKRGGIDPKNEQLIYAYASDRGLTPSQTKKAIEYAREGGAVGSVKFSEAKAIWTRLTGKKNMPQEAFDALRTQVPQGHAPSTAELEKLISQLYMSKGVIPRDVLWDKSASLYDAIKDKSTSNWLPDVTDAEKEEYAPIVRAMGYKGTDLETAIKKYKRDIVMGIKRLEADQ